VAEGNQAKGKGGEEEAAGNEAGEAGEGSGANVGEGDYIDFQDLAEGVRNRRGKRFMRAVLPYCASARGWLATDVHTDVTAHRLEDQDVDRINKNIAKVQAGFAAWCKRGDECEGWGLHQPGGKPVLAPWESGKPTAGLCMVSTGLFFARWAADCLRGGC
jgi:hypothetical protein